MIGEPLVVALDVGCGSQATTQIDDLYREIGRHGRVGQTRRGLDVPEQRPMAGYERRHESELLVERPHLSWRSRRHQHHLDTGLANVRDRPFGSLGYEPRTREQGAVEVDED